jgi:acyl-CoA thioesterase-1
VTRFIFLLVLGALSCWGQQKQAPSDTTPIIVAFGDSITAGHGEPAGYSYPDYLRRNLEKAGYKYRVVNMGVSGDTTTGGLARVGQVIKLKPAIVILELGGNDGLRGHPLAATRSNLEQIIVRLQKAAARVVLAGITLPPNYGPEYIGKFEAIYKDLAAKYKLPFIPFVLEGIAGVPGMMQGDGIHPTRKGNEIMAGLVMKTLKPLL